MNPSLKALTFGSATIDMISTVDDDEIERMTMHNATSSYLLLEEGRKIDALSINSSIGGGATNAAVSFARLGFDTRCFIRIGDDIEGLKIREGLETENVDTRFIVTDHTLPTGKAVMISSHVRNPTIFASRGANIGLKEEEITSDLFENQSLVYVSGLSGHSASYFEKIVRLAKEAGAYVATNPGILQLTHKSSEVAAALPYIDLLSINNVEAEQLAKSFLEAQPCSDNIPPLQDKPALLNKGIGGIPIQNFIQAVCKLGPEVVLVTNGSEGAYAGNHQQTEFHLAGTVEVGTTAGAGDAFATTFAAFVSRDFDLKYSLEAATINALSVIQQSDTHSGLMTWKAINEKSSQRASSSRSK